MSKETKREKMAGKPLTDQEAVVLKMIAEGKTVKDIASDKKLSVKTIEAHKYNLMCKLDLHNRTEIIYYAVKKGIIKIPGVMIIPCPE